MELPTYDKLQEKLVAEFNARVGDLTGCNCCICNNKGLVQRYEHGEIINRQCECMIQRSALRKLDKSGLAELIKDYTFSNYHTVEEWQKKCKQGALNFIKSTGSWFFIGGQSGAGKTHICTAMCGQFLKQNKTVRYMLWRQEIRKLKAVVNDNVEYEKVFYDFANAEMLYIDDLFKTEQGSNVTGADVQHTYDLINYRYNKRLCTIISSEKSINDLIDIDTATGSRIYQCAKGFTFELGKDSRKNWRLK